MIIMYIGLLVLLAGLLSQHLLETLQLRSQVVVEH